jgi:hypothetical protein
MKILYMITYRYRESLGEEDLRTLTKKFVEFGTAPGTFAQYERLDGKGGFVLQEMTVDPQLVYENLLHYAPWIEFEVFPITKMEDAFPVIQRVYG